MRNDYSDYNQARNLLIQLAEPLRLDPEVAERDMIREEARRRRREREIPRNRQCPQCKRTIIESVRWIVIPERRIILCRSCGQVPPPRDDWQPDVTLIRREGRYRLLRGAMPDAIARALIGRRGWSAPKVSKVRAGEQRINDEELKTVQAVWCALHGGERWPDVWTVEESCWRDEGRQLEMLRRAAGISVRVMADLLNWRPDRLRRAETGGTLQARELAEILEKLADLT